MCGIAGFVGRGTAADVARMTETLIHRGPDSQGTWFDEQAGVGLGHTRLSIIDLSDAGAQPMHTADGTLSITYNGEIYNMRQLREELIGRGHHFRSTCDTEVILLGYREWGEDVLTRLEGMFAFAVWDHRARRLFAARDRLGIKPFHYVHNDDGLLFGSEVKALLAHPSCKPALNRKALHSFLQFGFAVPPLSPFEGVMHLPPGCALHYDGKDLRTCRYWRYPGGDVDDATTAEDCHEALAEELKHATDSHMIADVEVGLTLSGGLDSSSVLASLARVRPAEGLRQIHAFTVGYGLESDEQHFARKMVERYPVNQHERVLTFEDATRLLPRILWHLEEPLPHIGVATTYLLAQFVRERVKVVLIGEGADELFGGYPYYMLFEPPYRRLVPDRMKRRLLFTRSYKMFHRRHLAPLLTPTWRPEPDELAWMDRLYDGYFCPAGRTYDRMLTYEVENELVANQLNRIDRLMMAHAVEARVPFLDRRFVELAARIPSRLKRRHGHDKTVFRDAMRPYLPEPIYRRPKAGGRGTQAITSVWFGRGLDQWCRRYLTDERVNRVGVFEPAQVRRWMDASPRLLLPQLIGQRKVVFFLALVHLWHALFIEGQAIDEAGRTAA